MVACIGVGSNLGDREKTIREACLRLSAQAEITLLAEGPLVETDPVGGPASQGKYLNTAWVVRTTLAADALLTVLLSIERELGRDRSETAVRWGPRPIDLDLLLFGDEIVARPELTVPHPRMHERGFVLEPLAVVVPELRHPGLGKTVGELWRAFHGA